jgi:tRNA pseudouridine synthase 10
LALADAKTLLRQYKLCKHCYERQAGAGRVKPSETCYICRGLMDNLDAIARKVTTAVKGYQFDTFLIGATLPTQLYEREDAIRARLKIRGKENIKNQMTRDLGIRLAKATRKKVDYFKPDIMINLIIDKERNVDVAAKSRPLAVTGRYVKKSRGMPQRQDRCTSCEGKGCEACNYSGLSGFASVEGVIAKELMKMTGGQSPKFSWLGSEDQSSLVLGTGRPFSARLSNPKLRRLKKKTIKANGVDAKVAVSKDAPEPQARFIVKTKIHAKCEKALTKQDLNKLRSLAGDVSFENKSKLATKKIYSAHVKQISGNEFSLTIVADGGLAIKQLVGGEEFMKPNVSEILGGKCECVTFDILNVKLQ